jgi:16S rRNA (uracil1498-N3)-methyltransferase
MKQSGRCVWPEVSETVPLETVIRSAPNFELRIAAHAGPDCVTLRDAVRVVQSPVRRGVLVTGPEGGFFPGEIEALRRAGFAIVSLGPRRLRAETAALAMLAQTLVLTGEGAGG